MKTALIRKVALIATAVSALQAAPAFSSHPANVVTGTVSSIGANQIVVGGVTYKVSVQGHVLSQLQQLQVGEQVDIVLSGPANSLSTQVVAIRAHAPSI